MIELRLTRDESGHPTCRVRVEGDTPPDKPVQLRILAQVRGRDPSVLPAEAALHTRRLILHTGTQDVTLPQNLAAYNYYGRDVSVRLVLRLVDNVGRTLAESRLWGRNGALVAPRPRLAECPEALVNPKDEYCFFGNLRALPAGPMLFVVLVGFTLYLAAGLNLLAGIHDQFVADQPYLYSHHGRGTPLLNASMNSLTIGLVAWPLIRKRLNRYGVFRVARSLPPLRRDTRIPARQLIHGRSRVELFNVTVRVVAANLECARRKPGRGDKGPREVRTPVRAVKLYERHLAYVPAGSAIEDYLNGDVDFGPMFRALYPSLMVDSAAGLDLSWQVQWLVPDLVDQAREGPTSTLRFVDFLDG
jgi:hypothetical protein